MQADASGSGFDMEVDLHQFVLECSSCRHVVLLIGLFTMYCTLSPLLYLPSHHCQYHRSRGHPARSVSRLVMEMLRSKYLLPSFHPLPLLYIRYNSIHSRVTQHSQAATFHQPGCWFGWAHVAAVAGGKLQSWCPVGFVPVGWDRMGVAPAEAFPSAA